LAHLYFNKEAILKEGREYVAMPKKGLHRMHAHINPFNPLSIAHPSDPTYVDWSLHYPSFYGLKNPGDIYVNTKKYEVKGDYKEKAKMDGPTPQLLDIGCGYGGLIFQLTKGFPDKLILGLEIRDKVANYVGEKINAVRSNSDGKVCANTAVIRSNAMKAMTNYFPKGSVEKMFFCFADPHFKKSNHRRRIVNTALLSEYAYVLKTGGKIYVVTDVKDLHDWQVAKLEDHPMFEMLSDAENEGDPCIGYMREGTDESRKVKRNGGSIWHAVFRKRDPEHNTLDAEKLLKQSMENFFN